MARITHPELEAFLAFGNASIAICEVKELARRREVSDQASDLLVEISVGHVRLRELFAEGLDDAVVVLSRDVMDLVSSLTDVLNQEQ
jgi:hypothetical protein